MFILNFEEVVAPLTDLLKKGINFEKSKECELTFVEVKAILSNYPALKAHNVSKPFKLAVVMLNICCNKSVAISPDTSFAPVDVLLLIKRGCSSSQPCSTSISRNQRTIQ